MIPAQANPRQDGHPLPHPTAPAWRHALREAFTRPADLLDHLGLDPATPALALEQVRDFPLKVPRGFAARMRRNDPADPLFLQVWPQPAEADEVPGYTLDAVGDLARSRDGGILHKYHGRALLVTTGACAVHCRYCFRRHFPYGEHLAARDHWRGALDALRADTSIEEVILSGGDPLTLADDKLAELSAALDAIPHLRRLRIHTRQPIVLPERVDTALLDWLGQGRLTRVIVIHANHAAELDDTVAHALARLRALGIPLLNQSVLLRGINDDAGALAELSRRLADLGVMPYYLHLLDRVHGAAHFAVDDAQAIALMQALTRTLPGYLVPRLAREEAGMPSKTLVYPAPLAGADPAMIPS